MAKFSFMKRDVRFTMSPDFEVNFRLGGAFEVKFRLGSDSVQVRFRFSSCSVQIQFRLPLNSVQIFYVPPNDIFRNIKYNRKYCIVNRRGRERGNVCLISFKHYISNRVDKLFFLEYQDYQVFCEFLKLVFLETVSVLF